ncbi:hypothetical protein D9M68_729510 [compost metagenome]
MQFENALYVVYKNEKEDWVYNASGLKVYRPKDLKDDQISIFSLTGPMVRFYPNGAVFDPRSTLYSGYWAYEKVADMVPMDYQPLFTVKSGPR